jgi:hypothetical protein
MQRTVSKGLPRYLHFVLRAVVDGVEWCLVVPGLCDRVALTRALDFGCSGQLVDGGMQPVCSAAVLLLVLVLGIREPLLRV